MKTQKINRHWKYPLYLLWKTFICTLNNKNYMTYFSYLGLCLFACRVTNLRGVNEPLWCLHMYQSVCLLFGMLSWNTNKTLQQSFQSWCKHNMQSIFNRGQQSAITGQPIKAVTPLLPLLPPPGMNENDKNTNLSARLATGCKVEVSHDASLHRCMIA